MAESNRSHESCQKAQIGEAGTGPALSGNPTYRALWPEDAPCFTIFRRIVSVIAWFQQLLPGCPSSVQ